MAFGRPTKYDPKYCDMLIEYMAKGYSYAAFAGNIHVNVDTLREWEKVHPDFSVAKSEGLARNLAFWEEQGIKGLWGDKEGPTLNSSVWIFNMKNRHRWRDKHDEEVQASNAPQVIINLPDNGRSAKEEKNVIN